MNTDSRYAAAKMYVLNSWPVGRKVTLFILNFVVAFLLTWWLRDHTFTDTTTYTLFILLFAMLLWFTEAIPPFAVGILIIVFQVYTLGNDSINQQPQDVTKYVNTWSSSVIWLMLGGFFLADAMRKVGLDQSLLKRTVKAFGATPNLLLFGVMMTTAFMSMIMSNTATTAMMIASIMALIGKLGKDHPLSKALLVGIPASATVGGMGTIIGSPPNAIAVGALNNAGYSIDFVQWMIFGFPIAIGLTIAFWYVLSKVYQAPVAGFKALVAFDARTTELTAKQKQRRYVVLFTMMLTLGLWLTSAIHKIPVAAVAAIPIVFLTVAGILDANDMRQLPWDTLMLVAGGLSLGVAIVDSGLAKWMVQQMSLEGLPLLPLLMVFGFLTAGMSNVMSNTAASTILIPIAGVVMASAMFDAALVIGLCASTALLLPVSTPPNAIAFSTGLLKQADFRLGGIMMGVGGPIVISIWVWLMGM